MKNQFTAAIRWCYQGISYRTKEENVAFGAIPFNLGNDDEYRAAIRLLEAAGKVDKQKTYSMAQLVDIGIAITAALPDPDQAKEKYNG